ncbi:PilZ domain-containing protein [Desulfovibrio sp.]
MNTAAPGALRPGDRVFLVVSVDPMRDRVDARRAEVLERRPDMLVVGQPDPAVPRSMLGSVLEVAVFPPAPPGESTCALPLGYNARLLRIFPSYPPSGGKGRPVAALGLTPPPSAEGWRPTAIRMQARARISPEDGLTVAVSGREEAELLDISGGGALLSLSGEAAKDKLVKLELIFPDEGRMPLAATIRWTATDPGREGRSLAGVQFKGLTIQESRFLSRLAQQILAPCKTSLKSPGSNKTVPWPTTFKRHG